MSWLSRLSPVPAFPAYSGPHQVGTVDVEIPSADLTTIGTAGTGPEDAPPTVAFRLFYPCETQDRIARPVRWIPQPQKTVIASFAKFLGSNSRLSDVFARFPLFLNYITVPAHRNAAIKKPSTAPKRWPVVFFSHGLAGSRNLYSHVCGSLASHGVVVVAMDHRDGSSPVQYVRATKQTKEQVVGAVKLDHSRTPEVFEGRDRQLRIRIWEMSLAYNAMLKIDQGEPVDNLDLNSSTSKKERVEVLTIFRDLLDLHRPGKVSWAGHSFGAATVIQMVKSVYYARKRPKDAKTPLFLPEQGSAFAEQITATSPIALYDLWGLPLSSPSQDWLAKRPLPCYKSPKTGGKAVIGILSDAFFKWSANLNEVKRAVAPPEKFDGPRPRLFYAAKSQHFSQSDVGILFPWVTERFLNASEPERIIDLNTRAVLQTMRECGIEVANHVLSEAKKKADKSVDSAVQQLQSQQVDDGDVEIFEVPPSIRGWVPIDLEISRTTAAAAKDAEDDPSPTLGDGDSTGKPQVVHNSAGKVA